jgi:hypothetical protein
MADVEFPEFNCCKKGRVAALGRWLYGFGLAFYPVVPRGGWHPATKLCKCGGSPRGHHRMSTHASVQLK